VNLAAFLEDGQQLYFPTKEERLSEDQPSLININTADEEALKKLPGIGESRAKAILKYRKEHGAFAGTKDLLSVPGISETTWEQFKDLITVR
ncbi:MAG: ComEA family DNA-binding protein, partial [Lachnospiraceae bacterium]|nr:ComEA family DNA-binding protein [Lachnospiraceae bacterium]